MVSSWFGGVPNPNSPLTINWNNSYYHASYLNIAKQAMPYCAQVGWAANMDSNGWPTGTYLQPITSGVNLDPTYYGRYEFYWSGTSAMTFDTLATPMIIYAQTGGNFVSGVTGAGETAGGITVSGASANIEFAFGVQISAFALVGGSNNVKCTVLNANHAQHLTTGMTVVFNNTDLPAGPNSDGSWTITQNDANSFFLQNSSGVAAMPSVTTGAPGVQTEAIYSIPFSTSVHLNIPGPFSSWSGWVWCKSKDLAAVQAGELVTPELVAAILGTKAAQVRFMDWTGVQNVAQARYAQRTKLTSFGWWFGRHEPAYWGGVATRTTSPGEVYTVSNPTASPASGPFVDGEIVIAEIQAGDANTTYTPQLAITGRGSAPIFSKNCDQWNMVMSGSVPPSGTTLTITFNGSGLSNFAYQYTTSLTNTNPAGTIQNPVYDDSLKHIMFGIRADVTKGATGSAYAQALAAAGVNAANANIDGSWVDQGTQWYYNPNKSPAGADSLNSGMTITGADPSGNITFTFGYVINGYIKEKVHCVFQYSALLGGWVTVVGQYNGGSVPVLASGAPLEWYCELCARANTGMWLNINIFDQATDIYNKVYFIATQTWQGFPAVKKLCLEWGNETWNNQLALWRPQMAMAASLGFDGAGSGAANSFQGLRVRQMAQQAAQAWSDAGRSRSQLKIINAHWFVEPNGPSLYAGSASVKYRFNGADLNYASNSTLAHYGGLGVTAVSTDYSTAPNRPIDWSDAIGGAPYWQGGELNINGNPGFPYGGVLANYSDLLVQSFNYVYGTTGEQQAALDWLYNPSANTGDLYYGHFAGRTTTNDNDPGEHLASCNLSSTNTFGKHYFGADSILASYDVSRHSVGTGGGAQVLLGWYSYEGGSQIGPTTPSLLLGTNSQAISSGTYDSTSGAVSLTTNQGLGDTSNMTVFVSGLTGTGAFASLDGTYTGATVSGTTVTFTAATGLGAVTLTGGIVKYSNFGGVPYPDQTGYTMGLSGCTTNSAPAGGTVGDTAALAAANVYILREAFHRDARYFSLVTRFMSEFSAVMNNTSYGAQREAFNAWYGFAGPTNEWALYPSFYTLGGQYQSYYALQQYR